MNGDKLGPRWRGTIDQQLVQLMGTAFVQAFIDARAAVNND